MHQYLIPANSKKGQLIFNVFRPIDLVIVLIGATITLIMMFAIPGDAIWAIVIKLLPITISLLLVVPVANYHNVLLFLQEVLLFYTDIYRVKKWKGWCASYGNDETK